MFGRWIRLRTVGDPGSLRCIVVLWPLMGMTTVVRVSFTVAVIPMLKAVVKVAVKQVGRAAAKAAVLAQVQVQVQVQDQVPVVRSKGRCGRSGIGANAAFLFSVL